MNATRALIILTLVWLGLLATSRDAATQFETPNRAFHNGTGFRLEGRHLTVPCASCHPKDQYAATPTTCYQCHWIRRKDDRYQLQLGAQCDACHRPTSWTAVTFNHASLGGVSLGANHQTLACASCHRKGQFTSAAADCVSCHSREYQATTSPNHAAAGFPTTCDSCHRPSEATWQRTAGGFSHAAVFALVGQHATATCQACHRNNVSIQYRGTPRDCIGCHQSQYANTKNPNHAAAGFPTTCETCHRPTDSSFAGAGVSGFNHNAVFALVGTHATQACAACHKSNVYKGTSRDCVGCHQAEYSGTTKPNHAAAGFPMTCDNCHRATDAQWAGISFNHAPFFALVGVHATQTCAACHRNSIYKGTARDCVGCHLPKYNATTSPNHVAAGFPTTCDSCHRATDTAWNQGRFTHARFPLTGPHNVTCAQCHTASNNYQLFSCTVCHARSQMDSKHRGRAGYVYDSNACYSCHPNGRH